MNDQRPASRPGISGYVWGYNNAGGLGIGTVARALRPVPVHLPEGTVDVQGGTDFTAALTSSGQVWTWGGNRYGQLGDATAAAVRFAPARVPLPPAVRIESISAGPDWVLALARHGGVYAWGRNNHGQLGDGTTADRHTPVPVDASHVTGLATGITSSAAITRGGELLSWGRSLPTPTGAGSERVRPVALPLPAGVKVLMVDGGARHLVVLSTTGELLTFGVDAGGKPLLTSIPTDAAWGTVTSISAGDNHTVALTDSGVVLAWGANHHGQLATRDTTNRGTPVRVRIPKLRGRVVAVAAGGNTVLAATSEHQIYAWGGARFGQTGIGDTVDQVRPRLVQLPDQVSVTGIHTGRYHNVVTTVAH